MSTLKAERQTIADLLSASDITATAHVPARPVAPLAMVLPGSPYLEGGDTFGAKTLRLDVWLVLSAQGDNEALSDAIDERVEAAVAALEADDLAVENVGQPIEWRPEGGAAFLVVIIAIRTEINYPPARP